MVLDRGGSAGLLAEERDNIFALSSGPPPAGVAIIRLSGPLVTRALIALCGEVPAPRVATLRTLRHPVSAAALDSALVLFFPAPASFTGEDVAELHVHGGRAVIAAMLEALAGMAGCRLAEPGEFTRRAFRAGRLDLTEAEGLADLVAAETDAQRRVALGQMQGSIRTQYESWRSGLIRVRAMIEAELDFSDEEGVAGSWIASGLPTLRRIREEIENALRDVKRGQRIREGAEIVILGAVNAGKSSLINALARKEAAIVSPEAGTTRDLVEVVLDLGGYRVTLVDTAGLRETDSVVEQEGVRRAKQRAAGADLILWLWADPQLDQPRDVDSEGVTVWRVATKVDLLSGTALAEAERRSDLNLSTVTGEGVEALLERLGAFLRNRLGGAEPALVTRTRHEQALREAVTLIDAGLGEGSAELAAESLRLASDVIGRVTGRVDVEEILDVVFGEFCIGK